MDDIQPVQADDIQRFALMFALALGDFVGQGLALAALKFCTRLRLRTHLDSLPLEGKVARRSRDG